MAQRRAVIDYEMNLSKQRAAGNNASAQGSQKPSSAEGGFANPAIRKRVLSPLVRPTTTGTSTLPPPLQDETEWEVNQKYKAWKMFKQQSTEHLQAVVDKVEEPVLDPRRSGKAPQRGVSPYVRNSNSSTNTRPSTATMQGNASVESFSKAANGLNRDIEQFKSKNINTEIDQPTWDNRFVHGRALSPKRFSQNPYNPNSISNSHNANFVQRMDKFRGSAAGGTSSRSGSRPSTRRQRPASPKMMAPIPPVTAPSPRNGLLASASAPQLPVPSTPASTLGPKLAPLSAAPIVPSQQSDGTGVEKETLPNMMTLLEPSTVLTYTSLFSQPGKPPAVAPVNPPPSASHGNGAANYGVSRPITPYSDEDYEPRGTPKRPGTGMQRSQKSGESPWNDEQYTPGKDFFSLDGYSKGFAAMAKNSAPAPKVNPYPQEVVTISNVDGNLVMQVEKRWQELVQKLHSLGSLIEYHDLFEISIFREPPDVVYSMICYVAILMGLRPSWHTIRGTLLKEFDIFQNFAKEVNIFFYYFNCSCDNFHLI
jgi:hypothetical protein